MLKYAYFALLAILAFGVVVALIPSGGAATAQSGVVLHDVNLRLYPAQDQDAEWRFEAGTIRFDPVSGESKLESLSEGERWVRGELDTLLSTDRLVIDRSDNLRADRASLYIPSQCVTVELEGDDASPVVIDQHSGFSGPKARIVYPDVIFTAGPAQASFDLKQSNLQNNTLEYNLDGEQTCQDGKLVDGGN